jgi:hypothetical protein
MANRRREMPGRPGEPLPASDAHAAIMVAPVVNVVDVSTGESEALWVWELED